MRQTPAGARRGFAQCGVGWFARSPVCAHGMAETGGIKCVYVAVRAWRVDRWFLVADVALPRYVRQVDFVLASGFVLAHRGALWFAVKYCRRLSYQISVVLIEFSDHLVCY